VRDRLRAIYENTARVDTTATGDRFVAELELPCAERASGSEREILKHEPV
jgi:hypothetical protein